jgi:hypothetical protein
MMKDGSYSKTMYETTANARLLERNREAAKIVDIILAQMAVNSSKGKSDFCTTSATLAVKIY